MDKLNGEPRLGILLTICGYQDYDGLDMCRVRDAQYIGNKMLNMELLGKRNRRGL